MPAIAVAPFVLKDAIFQVGTDTYEAHVASAKIEPSSSVLTWQGITPAATFTEQTAETWSCTVTLAQDWTTANSLAQYLLTNKGQKKTVVFKPKGTTTGMPIFTVDMIMAAPQIGGDVNTFQEATVTMGCVGVPAKTAAP